MITVRLSTEGEPFRGEPFEDVVLKCDSRDVMQWELKDHRRSLNQFKDRPRFTDFYEVAWHAAQRRGIVPQDYPLADFMDTFTMEIDKDPDAESGEDSEDPKPTGQGA